MAFKIAIDCGHGSNTAGKRTAPITQNIDVDGDGKIDIKKGQQYREHYASVMVATYLEKEFKRCGFDIFKSAWDDSNGADDIDVALSTRQYNIKNAKCDYSVSIHFNACGDGTTFNSGEGVETLIHSNTSCVKDSRMLANKVQSYLIQGTKQMNRGVKPLELAMCNCLKMNTKASILVELAFMTNKIEAEELMADSNFCKECAIEICKGFCDYLDVKYIVEKVNKQESKEYKVKVTGKDTIPVRKEANSKSEEVTRIKKDEVYTIIDEVKTDNKIFGKLKSGIGYINLEYCTKLI